MRLPKKEQVLRGVGNWPLDRKPPRVGSTPLLRGYLSSSLVFPCSSVSV